MNEFAIIIKKTAQRNYTKLHKNYTSFDISEIGILIEPRLAAEDVMSYPCSVASKQKKMARKVESHNLDVHVKWTVYTSYLTRKFLNVLHFPCLFLWL